jgi:hypothetical protein
MIDLRKETHSENEQKVREHRSQQGGLDQAEFALSESSDGDDKLDSVTEADISNAQSIDRVLTSH